MPLIPGIRTSVMTHDISFARPELRNSSAVEKSTAANPRDLSKPLIPRRTAGASRTIGPSIITTSN